MIERIRVAGFDGDLELTHRPGPDDFELSVLFGGAPLATVRTSLREGMQFIAPQPGRCQRHYIQVRGAFIDAPEPAWTALRDWFSARAAAAHARRKATDMPNGLPAITAPVALGAAA